MDLEAKIKEEPAWLEGKTTASLENFEHVSEVIALKEEVKSELTEPESSQEDSLEVVLLQLLMNGDNTLDQNQRLDKQRTTYEIALKNMDLLWMHRDLTAQEQSQLRKMNCV
ncbi:uncharacterized protein [Anabrus simplex]|uniref:uncharacterized protein n=1 Tax=Anabrus simplex TaxID=316456 RepID=UPI0035A26447